MEILQLYFNSESWTKLDLIQAAKSLGLKNYSKLSRPQLEQLLCDRLAGYQPPAGNFRLFGKPYGLSTEQYEAVTYIRGNHKIIAGAGAGKTRCLIGKLLYLLQQGAAPEEIVAITFTRDAFLEMRDRLTAFVGAEYAARVKIGTIHSFAYSYCRDNSRNKLRVIDDKDARRLMKRHMREMEHVPFKVDHALAVYEKWRDKLYPKPLAEIAEPAELAVIEQLFAAYRADKLEHGFLDFSDILHMFLELITANDYMDARWILVDEAQDLNYLQHHILTVLNRRIQNMTYFGDDWQSIYMFRGGSGNYFVEYPAHETVLSTNYRSVPEIVQFCNHITRENRDQIPKLMIAHRDRLGELPTANFFRTEEEECAWIVPQLVAPYSDHVILARTNDELTVYELACAAAGIPTVRRKGTSIFDYQSVQWLIAAWKMQTVDHAIFREIIWRDMCDKKGELPGSMIEMLEQLGSGQNLLIRLLGDATADRDVIHLLWIKLILKYVPEEQRAAADQLLKRISDAAMQFMTDWEYMESIHLCDVARDDDNGGVALVTVHASKGLEWRNVWLVGMNDMRCPHYRANDWHQSIRLVEEERRMFFVACSRARDKLALTYRPTDDQAAGQAYITPFMREVPKELFWTGSVTFRPCDGSIHSLIRCHTPSVLVRLMEHIEEERIDGGEAGMGGTIKVQLMADRDLYSWRNLAIVLTKMIEHEKRTGIVPRYWKLHITNLRQFRRVLNSLREFI